MKEHRNWEQMKRDNEGAAWIVDGEFCRNFIRTSSDEVNAILEQQRKTGLQEWQMPGFNGCWSCDHWHDCRLPKLIQA